MQDLTFNWVDYFVFSSLLGCSLIIGAYFWLFTKQDSKKEYLFGGKRMGYIPVAVSLLASSLSGITLMGGPAEVYFYGMSYTTIILSAAIIAIITTRVSLPIFFKLQLSCVNEYLELRFSKGTRKMASILYIFGTVTHIAMVIYVPALAFSQVTKHGIHTITPIIASICIIYTSMGGVKAVIWTDTFQFVFTVIGTMTILVVGIMDAGGISNVVKIAHEGHRTDAINFSLDVYKRNTFWAVQSAHLIGSVGYFACSQKFVQKYLSVRDENAAKKTVYGMLLGYACVIIVCTVVGLAMYAKYRGCDPYGAGKVSKRDQTIVHFVIDVAGYIPGVPGIFLASIVSSSLSTMSASMNALSGVIYDDFITHQRLPKSKDQDRRATFIMKFIVIIIGVISIVLALVIERLGTIYEIVTTIGSLLNAPILTLFVLGLLIPCVGEKGAIVGGYSSFFFLLVLVCAKFIRSSDQNSTLETSIEECNFMINQTMATTTTTSLPIVDKNESFFLLRVSTFYYTLMGTTVGIVTALITSWLTNEMDPALVNPDYLSPVIYRFLPKKKYSEICLKDFRG